MKRGSGNSPEARRVEGGLRGRWRHFWFEPGSALNLGVCRALFFGGIFLLYLTYDFSRWTEVSSAFWFPISLFQHLHVPVLPERLLVMAQIVWKVALGLSGIGLLTRASTVTAFILGSYLLGLPHSFGGTSHGDAILVFVLGIMALSRCGDSVSVDALILAARRGSHRPGKPALLDGEYTWPVRTVWWVMAWVFFAAAVSKIRHAGLAWVTSDTMAIFLTASHYHTSNSDPLTSWGLPIAQHLRLCRLLAAAALAIELGFPLALWSRRARAVCVPSAFLMQTGIRILMGPVFDQFVICYLFWIPWDRAGLSLASPRGVDRLERKEVRVCRRPLG